MARNDHQVRPAGEPDDDPPGIWRHLVRLRVTVQDWLWREDEKWAADRGHSTWRSSWGWAVNVRDRRFDRRHACDSCAGTGRHRITGADCADCGGVGVVTDPE
jgi:hypothetical protein